jgi:hypothetical protein
VNLTLVRPLVDRIQGPRARGRGGVPEVMARRFRQMYQEQIDRLRAMQPPPQGQIAALQAKIDQLDQFLGSLN